MTEVRWLAGQDLRAMLDYMEPRASARKFRLLACACCRRWRKLIASKSARATVESAERFADGEILPTDFLPGLRHGLPSAVDELYEHDGPTCLTHVLRELRDSFGDRSLARVLPLTHDVFGNPFRPVAVAPAVLAWNDGTVPKLAAAIYADRDFDRLPILADALEDSGCADGALLEHCRSAGPHARGCWLIDLLTGRE